MQDQLIGLRSSNTFESARILYGKTVDRLSIWGQGRRTASRVGDRDRYWSSTRDVLDEAMRLGFVEPQPLPSARRYVDSHRSRMLTLTKLGHQAADEAETNVPAFYDRLASSLYTKHPYFCEFIDSLRIKPIHCPEVSEGDVEQAGRSRFRTQYWVEYAEPRLQLSATDSNSNALIYRALVSVIRKRFGNSRRRAPTNKQMAEALNDAYIEAALKTRNLSSGPTDLKNMKTWGSQLMLLDQSRYVPNYEGQNVIWLAIDSTEQVRALLKRKTLKEHEYSLADAVVTTYRDQASNTKTSRLQAPYLPIYQIRAQTAFDHSVTRALVDLVIERLANGSISISNVQVLLHLGTTRQPQSEPVYRRGGKRRYEITIQSTS